MRQRARITRTALSIAAAGAVALATAGAAAPASANLTPDADSTAKACASTRNAVADAASPEARDLAADLGLTSAEATLRLSWQMRAEGLDSAARAVGGSSYGGLWIAADTARVTVAVVGSVSSPAATTLRTIAARCGLDGAVDLVTVSNSAATIDRAAAWLGSRLVAVNSPDTKGFGASIDYTTNRAILSVPARALSAGEQALVSDVRARLSNVVRITAGADAAPAACSGGNYCDPPLRGGVRMFTSSSGCSLGFIVRSKSDGILYAMTAGHCGGGTWSTQFPDGSTHVIGARHSGHFDTKGDAEILKINNPSGWGPRAWVLVEASDDTARDESYKISSVGTSTIGMRICKTGYAGSTDCGKVTALGVTVDYGDVVVKNLGQASFCVIPGDSGGPNYATHHAYGITSGYVPGASPCVSFYQGAAGAAKLLNVNIATE